MKTVYLHSDIAIDGQNYLETKTGIDDVCRRYLVSLNFLSNGCVQLAVGSLFLIRQNFTDSERRIPQRPKDIQGNQLINQLFI